MKKPKREKKRLPWWQVLIYSVIAAPFVAFVLWIGSGLVWLQYGAAILERFGKPSDILDDWGNPWRDNLPAQDDWRQIVQDSQFTLGEPQLTRDEGADWERWEVDFPDATYPNIDGGTALFPMAVEFARQHLGMNAEQAESFYDFSTTYNAWLRLCERSKYSYDFRKYFEDVDFVSWDTGRAVDLLLGAPPSKEIIAEATEKGIFFVVKPICRDAFVFITGKDNPVDSLTLEQVRGIFSGEIRNWKEVGGTNEKIRAFQREPGSGSQLGMEQLVMQGTPMADPKTVKAVEDMGGLIDAVAEYQNSARSIGYSYRYYIDNQYQNENIKQLKIEGVAPTDGNIISGAYPLSVEYYGVIRAGEEDGPGGLFLEWILSGEGQACVKQAGYIPMG